jgi:hypothetical protein
MGRQGKLISFSLACALSLSWLQQKLNKHDEEGWSLLDELTVDDVGQTVLWQASPKDMHWIAKLLDTKWFGDLSLSLLRLFVDEKSQQTSVRLAQVVVQGLGHGKHGVGRCAADAKFLDYKPLKDN